MTYPIILCHGICRFDFLWSDSLGLDNNNDPKMDKLHYFKGIRTMLKQAGYEVFHSKVPWAAGVKRRSEELKENIQKILSVSGAEKVNLIAHSMGGLDARHMMFNDRAEGKIHERIASLATISTPHEGTVFADWGVNNTMKLLTIIQKIGLDIEGLYDLRTEVCQTFNSNEEVMEFENKCESSVQFQTYAGKQDYFGVFSLIKLPFYIVEKDEGENDGLVSVKSAKWKEKYFKGVIENTDHLNEVGWWDPDQLFTGESQEELLNRIHKFYLDLSQTLS
jgi:triacylglycerol lipase